MKALVRGAVATLASALGVTSPARVLRGRMLVLTFHRVLPAELRAQYPYPGLVVTPEELSWLLDRYALLCPVTSLSEALGQAEASEWRSASVAVTFDDGQWDNHHYAAPVLARHNVKATFYVPVDAIQNRQPLWHDRAGFAWQCLAAHRGLQQRLPPELRGSRDAADFAERLKRLEPALREESIAFVEREAKVAPPDWARLMTWGEVVGLVNAGHEIGSHSKSHGLLTQMSFDAQRVELESSKRELECVIGRPVVSFCYPNGDHDRRVSALTRELGYQSAVTTMWGVNASDCSRFELRRCDMDVRHFSGQRSGMSKSVLDLRVAGLLPGLPK